MGLARWLGSRPEWALVFSTILVLSVDLRGTHAAEAPLGVYKGAGCDGVRKMEGFVAWFGRMPDRGIDFFAIDSWDAILSSSEWSIRCWSNTRLPMTFSLPMLPNDKGYSLADGASGKFDHVFQSIASNLVKYNYGNAVVRIGWEFNGGWYPWSAKKDPQSWVAYWRRIVEVMRGVPGAAFRFDWCPVIGWGQIPPDRVYPGNDYVDIIGLDVYNQTWNPKVNTPEQRWTELLTMSYGLQWQSDFAAKHGKPISFPEWGTGTRPDGHGGGDDAYFVEKMAAWISASNVAYHIYWDYPASDYNGVLSDGSRPNAGAAFLRSFGGGR